MDDVGNYTVTWVGGDALQAQRYAADATPIGTRFRVSTYGRTVSNGEIAMGPQGDFIAVYTSADGYFSRIQGATV